MLFIFFLLLFLVYFLSHTAIVATIFGFVRLINFTNWLIDNFSINQISTPIPNDDDDDAGDCLVVDCSQLSIKSYCLGSPHDSAIVDVSWSLDASRLVTVNADVRFSSQIIYI